MPNAATTTMTAAGLLSRLRLGWGPHQVGFRQGVAALAKMPAIGAAKNYYHTFWATPVFQRAGGEEWDKLNAQIREQLLATAQEQDTDQTRPQHKGSWAPLGVQFDAAGGRLMVTSLALMTLEVYYRDELPLALAPRRDLTKAEVAQSWTIDLSAADERAYLPPPSGCAGARRPPSRCRSSRSNCRRGLLREWTGNGSRQLDDRRPRSWRGFRERREQAMLPPWKKMGTIRRQYHCCARRKPRPNPRRCGPAGSAT